MPWRSPLVRSDDEMLAGAGEKHPGVGGQTFKVYAVAGRGGKLRIDAKGSSRTTSSLPECHPERGGSPARGRCRRVEGPLSSEFRLLFWVLPAPNPESPVIPALVLVIGVLRLRESSRSELSAPLRMTTKS